MATHFKKTFAKCPHQRNQEVHCRGEGQGWRGCRVSKNQKIEGYTTLINHWFFWWWHELLQERSYSNKIHWDLVLHVCKEYQSISIVESSWFKRLVMQIDPKVDFITCRQFVSKHLPNIIAKIMDRYASFVNQVRNYKCHFWSLDVHNWVWYILLNNDWWYLVTFSCYYKVMWGN